ncbi:MAG: UDP-N-acetylmuramoyl-tripeptide--D-alanyl-D-alanine ligase [Bryobacteraceae bacterium]
MTPTFTVFVPGIVALLLSWIVACRRATAALHMWQMDSYINSRYVQWLFAKPFERFFDIKSVGVALFALFVPQPYGAFFWIIWNIGLLVRKDTAPVKKPLDYTVRAKRTLWTARGILALAAIGLLTTPAPAGGLLLLHAAPGAILAAGYLLKPIQNRINQGFVRKAGRRLAELRPRVIGVAGSYGKTSTKYFLDVLLSEKHNVIKSPGNYNTLLGITRVVNDMLLPEHKVFIAEMGAYKRGEVKEIADLVHPEIGIITSIGPEHFERFLTMENIEQTNYELIATLPPGGLAVFNGDNDHCRKLAAGTAHTRVALYSLDNAHGDADLWTADARHTPEGLRFTIVSKDGCRAEAATPIVGRHNVLNILGAARIALEFGLTLEECAAAIAKLKPAPHRLEVKPGGGGTTIIDDSYNSNPIGAAEALHVLSQYTTGKRILITPGMIELGVLHAEKNEELGRLAAQSADVIILVGPEQTAPLRKGVREAGFPEQNLHVVKDLNEATAMFPKLLRPGDVLLFENDLPDLYTEK